VTTFGDIVRQLGGVPVGSMGSGGIGLAGGNVFFVNGADGLAGNGGNKPDEAKATLTQGYDMTSSNNNDIVVLVGDSSGVQVGASTDTSALAWANSYTHLIGACAPTAYGKRARLFHNFNASPILTISGSGCSFENFYFSHGRGSTTNKIGANVTGDYNYFGNVHFNGPSHATDGNQTSYSTVTLDGASATTFDRCVFGTNSTLRGNGATSLTMTGTDTVGQIWIRDCEFISRASNAGATHIEIGASVGLVIMENVVFINEGTTMTQAIDSNITDTTYRKIVFKGLPPFCIGATDFADGTGDGTLWVYNPTTTQNIMCLGTNPAVA